MIFNLRPAYVCQVAVELYRTKKCDRNFHLTDTSLNVSLSVLELGINKTALYITELNSEQSMYIHEPRREQLYIKLTIQTYMKN